MKKLIFLSILFVATMQQTFSQSPTDTIVNGKIFVTTNVANNNSKAITANKMRRSLDVGFNGLLALIDSLKNAGSTGWGTSGNSGTTPGTNFIGTTDNRRLMFKVNAQQAGLIDNTSREHTFFGYQAGLNTDLAGSYNNTAFGYQALMSNTTGGANLAVGPLALVSNTTGINNTAVGSYAPMASNTTGVRNVALGNQALQNNTTGNDNVAIGFAALMKSSLLDGPSTCVGNIGIGTAAMGDITTGADYNIAIGDSAGAGHTAGAFNIFIGNNAQANNLTASGQLSIQNIIYGVGNTGTASSISSGNIGIGIKNPATKLDVNGTVQGVAFKLSALSTAPASATATGTTGEIRVTAGFIYACIATNTWVRSALTTW